MFCTGITIVFCYYDYFLLQATICHRRDMRWYPSHLVYSVNYSGSSHRILNGVSSSSHRRLNGVSGFSHRRFNGVSGSFHRKLNGVFSPSHRWLNYVSGSFHQWLNGVTVICISLYILFIYYVSLYVFVLFCLNHSYVHVFLMFSIQFMFLHD